MYVIVRTENAGCFAGHSEHGIDDFNRITLTDARRLWYWDGAASLSELARRGPSKPERCKFPTTVESVVLTQVIEVIQVSDAAREAIESVPVWSA